MTKQHFIALADAIRNANTQSNNGATWAGEFNADHLLTLANFCASQNPSFKRNRWLSYIAGERGKNGGSVKRSK